MHFAQIRSAMRLLRGIFPITRWGMAILLLSAAVWKWEIVEHANQIFFAGIWVLLGVMALMLIFTVLGAIFVAVMTIRANGVTFSGEYEAEDSIETGYKVFSLRLVPFLLQRIACVEPRYSFAEYEGRYFWVTERLRLKSRGRINRVTLRICIGDIFGFTAIDFPVSRRVDWVIRPARAAMESMSVVRELTGEGYSHPDGKPVGELVEMRRYQAGDPLRLVLWKMFARSRKLLVRAPERAIVENRDILLYFLAGEDDNLSASLARVMLENMQAGGEVHFTADGSMRITEEGDEGMEDLITSAEYRDKGGEALERVREAVRSGGYSAVYVMLPASRGAWVERLRAFVASTGIVPVLILGYGGDMSKKRPRTLWNKVFFADVAGRSEEEIKLRELYQSVRDLGEIRAVHRESGEELTAAQTEALFSL